MEPLVNNRALSASPSSPSVAAPHNNASTSGSGGAARSIANNTQAASAVNTLAGAASPARNSQPAVGTANLSSNITNSLGTAATAATSNAPAGAATPSVSAPQSASPAPPEPVTGATTGSGGTAAAEAGNKTRLSNGIVGTANGDGTVTATTVDNKKVIISANEPATKGANNIYTVKDTSGNTVQIAVTQADVLASKSRFEKVYEEDIVVEAKTSVKAGGGIATGLDNLAEMFSAKDRRVEKLSQALAEDSNDRGGTADAADTQRLSREISSIEQFSSLQRKMFDSLKNAIDVWLR